MSTTTTTTTSARALRIDFDRAFAEAPLLERAKVERFLAIRVAGDPFVVRMNDIAGVAVDRKVVPVPTPLAMLLGVIGNRGALVPVYDLASLLGYARQPASKWLILCRSKDEVVALACDVVTGHVEMAVDEGTNATAEMIQTDDGLRKIIDVGAVVALIAKAGAACRSRE